MRLSQWAGTRPKPDKNRSSCCGFICWSEWKGFPLYDFKRSSESSLGVPIDVAHAIRTRNWPPEWRKHILYSLKRTSLGETAHCYSLWFPGSILVTWRRTTHLYMQLFASRLLFHSNYLYEENNEARKDPLCLAPSIAILNYESRSRMVLIEEELPPSAVSRSPWVKVPFVLKWWKLQLAGYTLHFFAKASQGPAAIYF
jgi:hypothetical protein